MCAASCRRERKKEDREKGGEKGERAGARTRRIGGRAEEDVRANRVHRRCVLSSLFPRATSSGFPERARRSRSRRGGCVRERTRARARASCVHARVIVCARVYVRTRRSSETSSVFSLSARKSTHIHRRRRDESANSRRRGRARRVRPSTEEVVNSLSRASEREPSGRTNRCEREGEKGTSFEKHRR